MTVLEGIDYSDSRPGGAAIVAAGKKFVMRYVPYGGYPKGLTKEEAADLHANGLPIGLVFESTGVDPLDGWGAGVYDAQLSVAGLADLGAPATLPVYFGVDFGATPDQYPAIVDYLQGAASVLGDVARVGVYGSAPLLVHCKALGVAGKFWQTYAWSGGVVLDFNDVFQYLNGQDLNGSVDLCQASNFAGMWMPDGTISTGETEVDPRVDKLITLLLSGSEDNGSIQTHDEIAKYRFENFDPAKQQSIGDRATSAIMLVISQHPAMSDGTFTDAQKTIINEIAAAAVANAKITIVAG